MKTLNIKLQIVIASLLIGVMTSSFASDATNELQKKYTAQGAASFSAQRGQKLWESDNNGRSCTSCHTTSVKNTGKHQKTGKVIKPMAPSVNPKRLTKVKKVKKWLLRNCKWTFKRECTPQEKGDILMWLSKQ